MFYLNISIVFTYNSFYIIQSITMITSFNSYYDSKGQDYFFGGVRDIFEADDMTLINLECVLSDATERVEKRWNLKGKPSYIGIMTGSSIEACSLGNNHTYDYGQAGLDDTRNVLDNAGIVYGFNDHTGIYETADGTRIGIVSVSLLSQNGDRDRKSTRLNSSHSH